MSQVESVLQCAAEAIAEIRSLVGNLRPMHIEELGLKDAIEGMLARVGSTDSLQVEWRLDDVNDVLEGTRATHVYRIVQEGVNNIVKHAQARSASVVMERDIHCVRLLIRDDGQGMSPSDGRRSGMGLTTMTERARLLGGQLWVESGEGRGTTLRVELPISEALAGSDPAALVSGWRDQL
jgi:signal transduction histidine kinase